jgi:hypothetical protein
MLKKLIASLVLLTAASSQICFARLTDDLVYVIPDSTLAQLGKTREQANKECPPCERKWKEAWAAEGKKGDSKFLVEIRRTTTRPTDKR